MKKYNINNYVKVKLTDLGKKILKNYYKQLKDLYPNLNCTFKYEEDNEGYIEIQLWQFMKIFGPYFNNGAPLVIESNTINFIEENFE